MREYCAATVAITAAALDILRAWDRPDWTVGPVRSLAIAPTMMNDDDSDECSALDI
jgi:hypothetical protein